jgi:predicted nucleotidyltransferase component of viral defense system
MSAFHEKILTSGMKKLYPKLALFGDSFYLAGGTGLALLLGHRISVDFDLFSDKPIKKTLLAKIERAFGKSPQQIVVNKSYELTIFVNGVKITFLEYPFPRILPMEKDGPIDILSSKEILATKAYSVGRRGAYKDYVDLYVGLKAKAASLEEIIDIAEKKYGHAFNSRLFLEQLIYLEDVEKSEIVMFGRPLPSKKEIRDFFEKKVSELKI